MRPSAKRFHAEFRICSRLVALPWVISSDITTPYHGRQLEPVAAETDREVKAVYSLDFIKDGVASPGVGGETGRSIPPRKRACAMPGIRFTSFSNVGPRTIGISTPWLKVSGEASSSSPTPISVRLPASGRGRHIVHDVADYRVVRHDVPAACGALSPGGGSGRKRRVPHPPRRAAVPTMAPRPLPRWGSLFAHFQLARR